MGEGDVLIVPPVETPALLFEVQEERRPGLEHIVEPVPACKADAVDVDAREILAAETQDARLRPECGEAVVQGQRVGELKRRDGEIVRTARVPRLDQRQRTTFEEELL